MSDLQNATITIDSITEKDNRISVRAKSGGFYSFFKTKKDGTTSLAYQQMQDMGLKSGITVDIAYDKTSGESHGKIVEYKNIKSFRESSLVSGEAMDKMEQVPNIIKARDYDRENFGKCKYGFLIEFCKRELPLTDDLEKEAELWAEASLRKLNEEILTEDIPF